MDDKEGGYLTGKSNKKKEGGNEKTSHSNSAIWLAGEYLTKGMPTGLGKSESRSWFTVAHKHKHSNQTNIRRDFTG